MLCTVRPMKPSEYPQLSDFLYDAIYQPDRSNLAPKSIITRPELAMYIEGFGTKKGDYCMCADCDGELIGAVWSRIIPGYGHVDDDTPELAISVKEGYRNQGLGTDLIRHMLFFLKERGYTKVSLSVNRDNYALGMYKATGFEVIKEQPDDYIMINNLH